MEQDNNKKVGLDKEEAPEDLLLSEAEPEVTMPPKKLDGPAVTVADEKL